MLGEVADNGNNNDVVLVFHELHWRPSSFISTISSAVLISLTARKVDDLVIVEEEEREDHHLDFFWIIFFLFSSPSDLQAQAPPHQSLSASSPWYLCHPWRRHAPRSWSDSPNHLLFKSGRYFLPRGPIGCHGGKIWNIWNKRQSTKVRFLPLPRFANQCLTNAYRLTGSPRYTR